MRIACLLYFRQGKNKRERKGQECRRKRKPQVNGVWMISFILIILAKNLENICLKATRGLIHQYLCLCRVLGLLGKRIPTVGT